ncbi:MAG: hypothetical protein ABW069_03520 [Duganella sp.]
MRRSPLLLSLLATIAIPMMPAIAAMAAAPAPAALIEQALRCELPMGKAGSVRQALKGLGARTGAGGVANAYVLPTAVRPFSLEVTRFSVTDDEVETYIATLPGARIEDVAKSAKLTQVAGGYGRDTKHGTLLADVRERGEVWLMCTVTQ